MDLICDAGYKVVDVERNADGSLLYFQCRQDACFNDYTGFSLDSQSVDCDDLTTHTQSLNAGPFETDAFCPSDQSMVNFSPQPDQTYQFTCRYDACSSSTEAYQIDDVQAQYAELVQISAQHYTDNPNPVVHDLQYEVFYRFFDVDVISLKHDLQFVF